MRGALSQYLAAELKRLAEKPTLQDALARIDQRRGGEVGSSKLVDDISEEPALIVAHASALANESVTALVDGSAGRQ